MRAQTVDKIERGTRVEVYRNLHNGKWSVRDCRTGLVVAHVDECSVFDARLVVQPAGRQRVIDSGRKNVHAFVRGYIYNPTPAWTLTRRYMKAITYNPSRYASFVVKATKEPILSATVVVLSSTGVLAYQARGGA
jgi:hypothetical protein